MKHPIAITVIRFALLLLFSISWAASAQSQRDFVQCLKDNSDNSSAISEVIYTPNNSSYFQILDFFIQNLRFSTPDTPKPLLIIAPTNESQIKTAIYCSKKHGLQMRIRSGGHDFEGSSYVSQVPFFVLDMFNLKSISIDAESRTAWVGAGASLGELYYAVNQTNSSLAFPGGYWPTVCFGGFISGGGYGPLVRKYGLAADNVIDARVVDANGTILDRESMGEDFFWAIRGGDGANFCIILAYKIQLVEVPKTVTAFVVRRTLEQNATDLVYKWQSVAPSLPSDILLSVELISIVSDQTNNRTMQASFYSAFLGDADSLLSLMGEHFPELGVSEDDAIEIEWVQYYAFHLDLPIESAAEILLSRIPPIPNPHFKAKSDFVQEPIPKEGLEEIWELYFQIDAHGGRMEWTPFGGRMDEIPESQIPFPHRAGNSFIVFKTGEWNGTNTTLAQERIAWVRKLHSVMGKYVFNNPRRAYADYRDLDLGVNSITNPTVEEARVWGSHYFKENFDRLVGVKTKVDPENFFNSEQSIPPLPTNHLAQRKCDENVQPASNAK